jgi:hypothetical protein
MSIHPAERGCYTIKHIILSEKAWLVLIIKVHVVPPRDLTARFVLPQWDFKHLVGSAVILPGKLAGIRFIGFEILRVLTLFLVVGEHDVDIMSDM